MPEQENIPTVESFPGIKSEIQNKESSWRVLSYSRQGDTGEDRMHNGDISNVPNPYIAFDTDCLLYVPERHAWKVKVLSRLPFQAAQEKAAAYYECDDGGRKMLDKIIRVAYNLMIVFTGPKCMVPVLEKVLESCPYTLLLCAETPEEFVKQVSGDSRITVYYSASSQKVDAINKTSQKKAILFQSWQTLGLEAR